MITKSSRDRFPDHFCLRKNSPVSRSGTPEMRRQRTGDQNDAQRVTPANGIINNSALKATPEHAGD
jgi:hypothetical protein